MHSWPSMVTPVQFSQWSNKVGLHTMQIFGRTVMATLSECLLHRDENQKIQHL